MTDHLSDTSAVDDPIGGWLEGLAANDPRAVEAIWAEYYEKLVQAARRRLGSAPRREADEEDVALSAIESFVRGAAAGRFPGLEDHDGLWRLLLTISARKVFLLQRKRMTQKRGGGHVRGESVFTNAAGEADREGLFGALGTEPSPALVAEVTEAVGRLVDELDDPIAEEVLTLKLEGYANSEIADRIGCATRTVTRKLDLVRKKWRQQAQG